MIINMVHCKTIPSSFKMMVKTIIAMHCAEVISFLLIFLSISQWSSKVHIIVVRYTFEPSSGSVVKKTEGNAHAGMITSEKSNQFVFRCQNWSYFWRTEWLQKQTRWSQVRSQINANHSTERLASSVPMWEIPIQRREKYSTATYSNREQRNNYSSYHGCFCKMIILS